MARKLHFPYTEDHPKSSKILHIWAGERIDFLVPGLPHGETAEIRFSLTSGGPPAAIVPLGNSNHPPEFIEGQRYSYNVWAGKPGDFVVIAYGIAHVMPSIEASLPMASVFPMTFPLTLA